MQAFVNIGVGVGIMTLTGQPLPLISRGGTSIMINSIYFGIIIAVTRSYSMKGTTDTNIVNHDDEIDNKIDVLRNNYEELPKEA